MGTFKLFFGIFVMVATIYLGVQLVPPYMANYQFEDEINTEATANTYNTKPEDAIREIVLKRAHDLDIPLSAQNVKVQRSGQVGSGSLIIEAKYQVHVDLPGYPLDLNFDAATKNKGVW
jgi:hypothetical protein